MKKNQNSNNNDKSKLRSAKSESSLYFDPSSAGSESSKKTSISDDELERSVYFPDVANMKGINILKPKNETQTSFEYLKNNTEEIFLGYPDIFDSDLKEFLNYIASEEEKNIDYKLLSRQILMPSKNIFSFSNKYNDLYNFWINLLNNINLDDIKLQQVTFLKDLMNRFKVYKIINKPKNELNHQAKGLYLLLLGNPNKTVDDIFLNTPTNKHNKEIYLQAKILFNLSEKFF